MVVRPTAHMAVAVVALLALCTASSAQRAPDPGGPGMPTAAELAPKPVSEPLVGGPARDPDLPTARAAIAVAGGFVFVVHGGILYQFTIDGLRPVASATLTSATKKAAGAQARRDKPGRAGKVEKAGKAGRRKAPAE